MLNDKQIKLNKEQQKLVMEFYPKVETAVNCIFKPKRGLLGYKYPIEDAYQDACYALCIAAYQYKPNHESGASFPTFAKAVIKNYVLGRIRSKKRYYKEVESEFMESDEYVDESDFLEVSIPKLDCERVLSFINRRKPCLDTRIPYAYDIFVLRYYYGETMKSIANQFNISKTTAYKRLSKATEDLQQQIVGFVA